jgi:hypothetical protein
VAVICLRLRLIRGGLFIGTGPQSPSALRAPSGACWWPIQLASWEPIDPAGSGAEPELHPSMWAYPTEVMMRRICLFKLLCLVSLGLALVASLVPPPAARAAETMMCVRSVAGDSTVYALSEVQRLGFAGDTLKVAAYGRTDRYRLGQVSAIDFLWWESAGLADPGHAAGIMKHLALAGNRPNPFRLVTRIGFDLPQAGLVQLVIYGADGRQVRRLVSDTMQPGSHAVVWNGADDSGERVGSGMYFYRLLAPGVETSQRMILLP